VKKIVTENGKATGVLLTDGSTRNGDIIISAADGHSTVLTGLTEIRRSEDPEVYDKLKPFPP